MKHFVSIIFSFLLLPGCAQTSSQLKVAEPEQLKEPIQVRAENQVQRLIDNGIKYYFRSDFPRAINQLEAAFLMDPENPETRSKFLLYYCYLSTGDYKKALSAAEYLVKLYPYQSLSYQQVGLAQLWIGNTAEALGSFRRAAEFDAHAPKLHFYTGLAHGRLKSEEAKERSFKEAESEYLQILSKNPKDSAINFELAALYLFWNRSLDKVTALIETARTNYSVQPIPQKLSESDFPLEDETNLFPQYYLPLIQGIYSYRKGDGSSAIKLFFEAMQVIPSGAKADLAELYFYLGQSHLQIGQNGDARLFLEQSLSLDPKGPFWEEAKRVIRKLGAG